MAVLEVRNVKKVFGDNVILRGIDLDVQKGDVIVTTGGSPNGKSGNSDLINVATI